MPDNNSQSMTFSGGQFSNVQIGQAGGDLTQTSTRSGAADAVPTDQEVSGLLAEIETLLNNSDLTANKKTKAVRYLGAAQAAIADDEPDKQYIAGSLQQATKVFKEAGATVEAGHGLWEKAQPVIAKILPWLGTAASLLA